MKKIRVSIGQVAAAIKKGVRGLTIDMMMYMINPDMTRKKLLQLP